MKTVPYIDEESMVLEQRHLIDKVAWINTIQIAV
jgi:hypothetical protein